MAAVVIDTSVIIGFLKGNPPEVKYLEKVLPTGNVKLTAITIFELKVGIIASTKRDKILDHFLRQISVIPFDREAALEAARIENNLRQKGEGIGAPDTLIAGICLAQGLTLVTLNLKHFNRIPGLKVKTPEEEISKQD